MGKRDRTRRTTIRKVTVVLAIIVALCAVYLLTMPAFTVSRDAARVEVGIRLPSVSGPSLVPVAAPSVRVDADDTRSDGDASTQADAPDVAQASTGATQLDDGASAQSPDAGSAQPGDPDPVQPPCRHRPGS